MVFYIYENSFEISIQVPFTRSMSRYIVIYHAWSTETCAVVGQAHSAILTIAEVLASITPSVELAWPRAAHFSPSSLTNTFTTPRVAPENNLFILFL